MSIKTAEASLGLVDQPLFDRGSTLGDDVELDGWGQDFEKIFGDVVQDLIMKDIISQVDIDNATFEQNMIFFNRFLNNKYWTFDESSNKYTPFPAIIRGSRDEQKIRAIFRRGPLSVDRQSEREELERITDRFIANNLRVKTVLIYGSRASKWDFVDDNSDLDVVVVLDEEVSSEEQYGLSVQMQEEFYKAGLSRSIKIQPMIDCVSDLDNLGQESLPFWTQDPDSLICCDPDGVLGEKVYRFLDSEQYSRNKYLEITARQKKFVEWVKNS